MLPALIRLKSLVVADDDDEQSNHRHGCGMQILLYELFEKPAVAYGGADIIPERQNIFPVSLNSLSLIGKTRWKK